MTFVRLPYLVSNNHQNIIPRYVSSTTQMITNYTEYQNFNKQYFQSMPLEYKIAYYLRVPVIGPSPHLFLIGYILLILIINGVENLIKCFKYLKKKNKL